MSRVVSHSVMDTRAVDQATLNYGGGGRVVSRVVSHSVLYIRGVDHGCGELRWVAMLCPGLFRTA